MHALSLLVALSVSAGPDGNTAYEKLKTLEGSWKTASKEAPIFVTLRLVAGGTAVLETISDTNRSQTASVTVYAVENGELVATRHDSTGATRFKLKDGGDSQVRFVDGAKTLTVTMKDNKLKIEAGKQSLELLREYLDTLK